MDYILVFLFFILIMIIFSIKKNKELFSNIDNLNDILSDITNNKIGIEIGGPSKLTGTIIYENAKIMDNVIFSNDTIWSKHNTDYNYFEDKKGSVIINCSTNITNIKDNTYDFLFASHVLEHIANPIKAVTEWIRIIKNGGYLILILPEKSQCFDHKRNFSKFSVLLNQHNNNVDESDLSTLPEILENHDLSKDILAGTYEQFKERSLKNFENRALHHYVYSPELLKEIANYLNCKFIYTVTNGIDIWFIMQK